MIARPSRRCGLLLGLSLAALAACGDDASSAAIDAPIAIDAAVDAPICDLTNYPPAVRVVSVDLMAPTTLTLDGAGSRCEQIVRALLASTRPPELAQLDTGGVTGTCLHDDVLDREIVRLRAPRYAGVPVYAPVQDALVHVDAANVVVFLHGDFLPAGAAPGPGCLSADAIGASVPGRSMGYLRFSACVPQGEGAYPIAADDEIEVGAEGVYLDQAGDLHRARAVEVYLRAGHVDSQIGNSDAYCCSGASLDHCVGQRLFIDAMTGDLLGQEPRCHIC